MVNTDQSPAREPCLTDMQPLDAGVRAAITALVFRHDAPLRADVTIVLGMTLWQNPLAAALRLYEAQSAGTLVFTGGHNPRIGRAEGEVMAEAAIAQGIPREIALCESRARHTGENLAFSWAIIAALATPVRAVNVVGLSYHIPRALLTARSIIPESVFLGHQSYPSIHFGPDDWHLTARGRRDVLGEVAKLERYFPAALPPELTGLQLAS